MNLAKGDRVEDSAKNVNLLGMRWKVDNDTLSFHQPTPRVTLRLTKREILSQSSKIFDPLGLLSPITVKAKIFIQSLWRQNFTWDECLTQELSDKWNLLMSDLEESTKLNIHRHIPINESIENELHIFTDASLNAYGACAYLVNGENSTLLISKNRVAPLKSTTLPQLELMEAVIGDQLADHLESILNIKSVTLWCDSQIVLHWLQ